MPDPTIKTLLAELIQMPTLTDETATCQAAIDWIKYQLKGIPLYVHDLEYKGHPALIITTRRTKRPKLMLHCHLDVAPAASDFFKLTERDGRYYGRGVFDMKYAATVYIRLLQELGPGVAKYSLGIIFTSDEELTGGNDGCAHIVGLGWGGKVVINADAIGHWNIERAAKGILRMRVDSLGVSGHGSRPWLYRNAINQLMLYLDEVATHFPTEPCGDPGHAHHTFSIGIIQGGRMSNQVAGEASAQIDIRLMPGRTLDRMEAMLREIALSHPHISLCRIADGPAISLDPLHPEAQRLARIIRDIAGVEPAFTLSHGSSENPFYVAKGMPVLMFGPPGGGHHSDDEWISIEGIAQFKEIILRLIDEIAPD